MAPIHLKIKKDKNFQKTLRKGFEKIRKLDAALNEHGDSIESSPIYELMQIYAEISLRNALMSYDDSVGIHNLTGNTRTSFCSAVYYGGKLVRTFRVIDIVEGRYTFREAKPGDPGGSFSFRDYGTGELIGKGGVSKYVREYSDPSKHFIPVGENDYAYLQTYQWLKDHRPHEHNGFCVVVASVSPYVEYIHKWLDLDILDSNFANLENDIAQILRTVVKH